MALSARPYLQRLELSEPSDDQWEHYPFNIPAVREMASMRFHADVTFLIGENGSGKSTVLEAIAMALGFAPEGGGRNISLSTTDSVSALHQFVRLVKSYKQPRDRYFLRAESLFNVATLMDDINAGQRGYKPLHLRSHGEAFMSVLLDTLRGNGLYLLDEPEAALSPQRQLAALTAIHQLVRDESQFIIATHSPILLAYPNATILQFDATGITEVAYEDTEHYAVTRDFLNHYPRRIAQLLDDD